MEMLSNVLAQMFSSAIGALLGYLLGGLQERKNRWKDFVLAEIGRYETDIATGLEHILENARREGTSDEDNKRLCLAYVKDMKNSTRYVVKIASLKRNGRLSSLRLLFSPKNSIENGSLHRLADEIRRLTAVLTGDDFTAATHFLPNIEEAMRARANVMSALQEMKLDIVAR